MCSGTVFKTAACPTHVKKGTDVNFGDGQVGAVFFFSKNGSVFRCHAQAGIDEIRCGFAPPGSGKDDTAGQPAGIGRDALLSVCR